MLFTSPPIHRWASTGSSSGKGGGDLQRLGLSQVALDSDDDPALVDQECVRGQAQRLAAEVAVGVGEENLVRLAGDPPTLVPVDGHVFDGRALPKHLAEVVGVYPAADLGDEDSDSGLSRCLEARARLINQIHLARWGVELEINLVGLAQRRRHEDLPGDLALRSRQRRWLAEAQALAEPSARLRGRCGQVIAAGVAGLEVAP